VRKSSAWARNALDEGVSPTGYRAESWTLQKYAARSVRLKARLRTPNVLSVQRPFATNR